MCHCGSWLASFIRSHLIWICIAYKNGWPGRVAQSVTCLATDASLTADPGGASLIPAWSHTFLEIDNEIISTVILLPSKESFKKVCFSYKQKYVHGVLVTRLFKLAQEKSVVWWTDRPAMTLAVDLGCKATKQTKTKMGEEFIGKNTS